MANKIAISLIVSALLVPALFSCKTTEANYRATYEKTMQGREESQDLDSTIYGANRRVMSEATISTSNGNIDVRRQRVRLTNGTAPSQDALKQYCVVVGQFKQLFNAKSLRDRIAGLGYHEAFVVETSEPYYYIVAAAFNDAAQAAAAMKDIEAKAPITMKKPLPFILEAVGRHSPAKAKK